MDKMTIAARRTCSFDAIGAPESPGTNRTARSSPRLMRMCSSHPTRNGNVLYQRRFPSPPGATSGNPEVNVQGFARIHPAPPRTPTRLGPKKRTRELLDRRNADIRAAKAPAAAWKI
jgi:hypothetical protein